MKLFFQFCFSLLLCFIVFSCKEKTIPSVNNTALFKNYIQSYGPTSLSKNGEIFIDFKPAIFPEVNQETLSKYFLIEPYVKANIYVKDNHVLVIDPDKELESNKQYNISFDIKRFLNNQNLEEEKFEFSTMVIPQFSNLQFKDYVFYDDSWFLDVQLSLNDIESLEELRKNTKVVRKGKRLDFSIILDNPLKPIIRINDVKKSNEIEEIEVSFDAKNIGAESNSSYKFKVPQRKNLELLQTNESPESKSVIFIFNKALGIDQNLDGFISISETKKNLDYKIKANSITVFYDQSVKSQTISIKSGIKSLDGDKLSADVQHIIGQTQINPKLKNVGLGHIIPTEKNVVYPFESIGLKKVRVEIFKIHSNNLQQFYQSNNLNAGYRLEFLGEVVHSETLDLAKLSTSYDPFINKRYHFNLKNFIQSDPSAIYEIRLGFLPEDVIMECANEIERPESNSIFENSYYGVYGYYDGFNWKDREDPCEKAYYQNDNFIRKMVVNSNLGIIAKKTNNGGLLIYINDINSTNPISEASVFIYNKSQRELVNTKTDGEGRVFIKNMEDAFMVKVKFSNKENWLRIQENDGLSLSKFKVSGRVTDNGLDGFIYTERNVWRPGDSMFVDFVVHDPNDKIPSNHPVKLKLYNPEGKAIYEDVNTTNYGPFYTFAIPTKTSFLTGDYQIKVNLGANEFTKSIKIETIKPNKFAISNNSDDISSLSDELRKNKAKLKYQVKWLYGAPAKNKLIQVELAMNRLSFIADGYADFRFSDPRNTFNPPNSEMLSEGKTDDNGGVEIDLKIPENIKPPEKLSLLLKTTAYESSGDFSTDVSRIEYSAYSHFVGIALPKNEYNYKRVGKGKEAEISFISLSESEKEESGRSLKAKIYKMENYWWYNSYNDAFSMTNGSAHVSKEDFDIISDRNGKSAIKATFNSYGRYYIQVCDEKSGHCSGDYLYVGYPWNDSEMSMAVYEEAAQLNFESTEDSYKSGETVELNVPSYFDGKALISLENGNTVVQSFWTEVRKGNNKIKFTAQKTMFPTIYAHVTLLQAHKSKSTDMPIRSYGVIPISIEDTSLKLNPEVVTSDELKPKEDYEISVNEKDGKPMYYTIAVVDEGLLNITNFQTPDPFNHFYAKPALGVRTFDNYNEVMSNYGKEIDQLFSIGGDGQLAQIENAPKANRFKSVVTHIGPFFLEAGAQNVHKLKLPNYIGSVRLMLVAANNNQYGKLEKNIPVKQDLMILTTLPRTLAPGDNVAVPLTIFTMKDGIGDINYGLKTEGVEAKIISGNGMFKSQKNGEELIPLQASIGSDEGIVRFYSEASSSKLRSEQELEVQVENPNPIIRRSNIYYLEGQGVKEFSLQPLGKHKSEYSISVSSLAPVNIEEIIDGLTRYPYGCLEQRTSAAYAYLYQQELAPEIAENAYSKQVVKDHLNNLYRFKQTSGYSLWPGYRRYDSWLTSFVGDFLIDAKAKGFGVNESIMNDWINDQKAIASNWMPKNDLYRITERASVFLQSYRLYTLAKAKKPSISEMNRLREDFSLDYNSGLLLAAAYAESGRTDIAESIFQTLNRNNAEAENYRYTYGSNLRNIALRIILFDQLGKDDELAAEMKYLNDQLNSTSYMSTQTSIFVLRAIACVNKKSNFKKEVIVNLKEGNTSNTLSSESGQIFVEGALSDDKNFTLNNKSTSGVFVQITRRAKEDIGVEKAASKSIQINTVYLNKDGQKIDVTSLEQGTDFIMLTTVSRNGDGVNLDNLALRQAVPSGWEILNDRINDFDVDTNSGIDYQDFRDSKVHSFFSLENRTSIEIAIKLKATYAGTYYQPKTLAESMYLEEVYAEESGFKCTVKAVF